MLAKTELTQIQKDLLAAADYIEEHGWTQCRLYNEHGNVCLSGALVAVITGSLIGPAYSIPIEDRIINCRIALCEYLKTGPVFGWNDTVGRTKDEVIQALRNAAFND